jgi:hypothetical protein
LLFTRNRCKSTACRTAALRAIAGGDTAAHLLDDAPANAQAEAGALGRDERMKEPRQHVVGNAGTVILDPDAHGLVLIPLCPSHYIKSALTRR